MKIKLLYEDLIKEIKKIIKIANVKRQDDCWLIVTRGQPIANYVPIIDICIADSPEDYLEMNQELRRLSEVYCELERYNQKELTIDNYQEDDENDYLDLSWYLKDLIQEPYDFSYEDTSYDPMDEYDENDFFIEAIKMCIYLDNKDNLILNEDNHDLAFMLVKRLMRLMD